MALLGTNTKKSREDLQNIARIFPGNLQLSKKCFQKTLNYRDKFINHCDSYLAISWQKYATIYDSCQFLTYETEFVLFFGMLGNSVLLGHLTSQI